MRLIKFVGLFIFFILIEKINLLANSVQLPDGRILECGGVALGKGCRIYTSTTNPVGFISLPDCLKLERASHTVTLLPDGRILIVGGRWENDFRDTAEILTVNYNNGSINCSTYTITMSSTARANHTASIINVSTYAGNVLICGGETSLTSITNTCEIFITSSSHFISGPSLHSPRAFHTANVLSSGKIFFIGGRSTSTYHLTAEIYDPVLNAISIGPSSPLFSRSNHAAITLPNDHIIVIGGYNGYNQRPDPYSLDDLEVQQQQDQGSHGYVDNMILVDANGAIFLLSNKPFDTLPYRISDFGALLHPNGRIYISGGIGNVAPTYFLKNFEMDKSTIYLSTQSFTILPDNKRVTQVTSHNASYTVNFKFLRLKKDEINFSGRVINGDIFSDPPRDENGNVIPSLKNDVLTLTLTGAVTTQMDGQIIYNGSIDPSFNKFIFKSTINAIVEIIPFKVDVGLLPLISSFTSNVNQVPVREQVSFNDGFIEFSHLVIPLNTSIFNGAICVGSMSIKTVEFRTDLYLAVLNNGSTEFFNVSINNDGEVVFPNKVYFSNVSGLIRNTTDHLIVGSEIDFSAVNVQVSKIRVEVSFVPSYFLIEKGTNFGVGNSTVVVRKIIFSDIDYYQTSNGEFKFYDVMYVDKKTANNILPKFLHNALISRNASIILNNGFKCDNCSRNSVTYGVSTNVFVFDDIKAIPNAWNDVKSLNYPRAFHTSTVLSNGKILTCGGTDGFKTLSNCEIYDKVLDSWVVISTMNFPRSYHTATLLVNGNVLITGGMSNTKISTSVLDTTEIFWPLTNSFVEIPPMKRKRAMHSAILLPNGNVLVTGGFNETGYLSSCELYIATANVWIEVGNMTSKRAEHSMTYLNETGNILICGGINENGVVDTCDIYISTANQFMAASSMSSSRKNHMLFTLLDGRILTFGGHSNYSIVSTVEDFNGDVWRKRKKIDNEDYLLEPPNYSRTYYKGVLLPTNDIVISGGTSIDPYNGIVTNVAKRIKTDFLISPENSYDDFGRHGKIIGHSMVKTKWNTLMVIGGFDGNYNYLKEVKEYYYTGYTPNSFGKKSDVPIKPVISTYTAIADHNEKIIYHSTYSNLRSVTDFANTQGSMRSDFANPHIKLGSLNENFYIDYSTQLFDTALNSWETSFSTITIVITTKTPYGWYYLYNCVSNICSDPVIVQVSTPRPSCLISTPTAKQDSVGISSMTWEWSLTNILSGVANGFAVFSSSDIFISTVPFPTPIDSAVTFTLTGLKPNTPSRLKIACYNIGGFSDKSNWTVATSTIHTLAKPPKDLRVTYASFDTVELEWDGEDNNPDYTPYQLEISTDSGFNVFSIAISFLNNYTKTKATIRNLKPNTRYFFRVKARNGDGIETSYSNVVSTITVGNITGLSGMALSTHSIRWMWNPAGGATGYEIYEYKIIEDPNDPIFRSTIEASVLIATITCSTPSNSNCSFYIWSGLNPNSPYQIKVRSIKKDAQTNYTTIYGPFEISPVVYTLAATPSPAQPEVFRDVTTGSIKVVWNSNGNSVGTSYRLDISLDALFSKFESFNVESDSTTFPNVEYRVTGLLPNTKYYFRVFAINKDGVVNPVSANLGSKYTLAQAPSWVYVSSVSLKGVLLQWDTGDNPPYTIYQVRATSVSFETPYVATPVPFGLGYTGDNYLVTSLWLNTSYYFDVTARNMEGVETFSMQTATPAYIFANFASLPQGAIGVEVDTLDKDYTFKGLLADGRNVELTFYRGTFSKPNPFAISSLSESQLYSLVGSSNPCGYTFGGSTIAFGIYSLEQPYLPVKFKFNYFYSNPNEAYGQSGISSNSSKVTLARYNPQTGQCLPVKTEVDTSNFEITAYLNHFSIYQLILLNPANSLDNVKIYPNPFYPNRSGQGVITITNLPNDAKITIYTISGVKVFEARANSTGTAYWDGKNSKGQSVGSGIYLCLIKSRYGTKTLKVAIER